MITYLFGAGASASSIGTINTLANTFSLAKQTLNNYFVNGLIKENNDFLDGYLVQKGYSLLHDDFNWIIENISEGKDSYSSIDTLAQVLYNQDNEQQLNRLKYALNAAFIIKQHISGVDKRYQRLINTLFDKELETIPKSFKFITWNYDLNIEQVFFDNRKEIEMSIQSIHDALLIEEASDKALIKLNGSCGVLEFDEEINSEHIKFKNDSTESMQFNMEMLCKLRHFMHEDKEFKPSQTFHFEHKNYSNDQRQKQARLILAETSKLVIVGYSFPSENREVDYDLLSSLKEEATIFIQDLNGQAVKQKMLDLMGRDTYFAEYNIKIEIRNTNSKSPAEFPIPLLN